MLPDLEYTTSGLYTVGNGACTHLPLRSTRESAAHDELTARRVVSGPTRREVWGMTIADRLRSRTVAQRPNTPAPAPRRDRDLQQTLRLLLATVWLMDAALQLQSVMFTPGPDGFSGMLHDAAAGNPSWIAHTITWNASLNAHQPILTNGIFSGVQFIIAFGIAWRPTCRYALALSVMWSVLVWWFGEGLGGVLTGAATPFGGGPGAVVYYALLAVVLWPTRASGGDAPFVAARTLGVPTARALWASLWALLALLAVVGHGRSPLALHDLVADTSTGEPGWLLRIDRWSQAVLLHDGTTVAVLFALFCILVAASVYLRPAATQVVLVAAIVVFALVWVAVENLGGVLTGSATDPNSGLLVILFVLAYWPLPQTPESKDAPGAVTTGRVKT